MSAPLEKTKTSGVYKRGNRYVVVFRDSRGKQRKRSARTLVEARKLKASLTTDADRGELDLRLALAEARSAAIARLATLTVAERKRVRRSGQSTYSAFRVIRRMPGKKG